METSHPLTRQIEVAIADPEQLFDRLDPSARRHLDDDVEQFIVHRAQQSGPEYSLLVLTSGRPLPSGDETALSKNIREHFAHRAEEERVKLRQHVRAGTRDFAIAMVFLFACAALGVAAVSILPAPVGLFVEQGLTILGWVALWRPVDLFLYELRPLRLQRDVLSALSRMEVWFQPNRGLQPTVAAA